MPSPQVTCSHSSQWVHRPEIPNSLRYLNSEIFVHLQCLNWVRKLYANLGVKKYLGEVGSHAAPVASVIWQVW